MTIGESARRGLGFIPDGLPLLLFAGLATLAFPVGARILNPDAVSYYQLARHLMNGEYDLAVSGYWGPLFVGLIAPLTLAFDDPAVVVRTAVAFARSVSI